MKRGWILGLALILLLTATVAALWMRLPPTHDLAHLAKLIPNTLNHNISDYSWINDSSLLTFQYVPGAASVNAPTPVREAFIINTATGRSTLLPALNNFVGSREGIRLCSLDGQWVLSDNIVDWGEVCPEGNRRYEAKVVRVMKADGSRATIYKFSGSEPFPSAGWIPNGQNYVFCFWEGDRLLVEIHNVNNPTLVRTIGVHDPQGKLANGFGSEAGFSPFFMTSDQHLLFFGPAMESAMNAPQGVILSGMNLHSNPVPIAQNTFSLPLGAFLEGVHGEIVPSPNGKRIAWILHFNDRLVRSPNIWTQFWNVRIQHKARLLPENIPTEEIWVNNRNGSDMHQIAYQEDTGGINTVIANMKWTPDGKALSFMYNGRAMNGKDGLYTIPAD